MFIEQIIRFELRGLGLPGRICTSAASNFYYKTKIIKENFRVDYYLLLKYCMGLYLAFPYLGQIT